MTGTFPTHGRIPCRVCWTGSESVYTTADRRFRVVNDPGAWGSARPQILVLGISKGFTQARAFADADFDRVPFKDCRPRLRRSLAAIGIMAADADIDRAMSRDEQRYAWGSLVRCSLSGWDDERQAYGCSTKQVLPAFKHADASRFLRACMQRYLGDLPTSVRIVVLLGSDENYIRVIRAELQRLHGAHYAPVNAMAHQVGRTLYVHTAHPSPLNGYFDRFVDGGLGEAQTAKRQLARSAVARWLSAV